ncbi:MAG TPA: GIY-YIG nuclease family protein [Patescibacteria group bacterium]|nr:GIY-YIG nuclease family protein [Patescibacteria group bacterium]
MALVKCSRFWTFNQFQTPDNLLLMFRSHYFTRESGSIEDMPFIVYILRTSRDTLYTGQTNDLKKRMEEHRSKTSKSSKYMRAFGPFELVHSEEFATRSEAMQREAEIKKLTKIQKENLISNEKYLLQ